MSCVKIEKGKENLHFPRLAGKTKFFELILLSCLFVQIIESFFVSFPVIVWFSISIQFNSIHFVLMRFADLPMFTTNGWKILKKLEKFEKNCSPFLEKERKSDKIVINVLTPNLLHTQKSFARICSSDKFCFISKVYLNCFYLSWEKIVHFLVLT